MPLIGRHEYLLQTTKAKRYNLYLDQHKDLYCISSNENRQWAEKNQVFSMACHSFDVDLAPDDSIHAVSCHTNGFVYYHWLFKGTWKSKEVFQHPLSEKVLSCRIKSILGQTHLVFMLNQGKKTTLYHYLLKADTDEWVKSTIAELSFNKYVNPINLLTNGKENSPLLLFYSSLVGRHEQIYFTGYDISENSWFKPKQLTDIKSTKLYMDCLMDQRGTLHLTWSDYEQDTLSVQYLRMESDSIKTQTQRKTLSKPLNCSFPQLILLQNQLYLIWIQFNHLTRAISMDNGKTWSKPENIKGSKLKHFKRYRYISNLAEEKEIKGQFLYGTLYPGIQFLGLGGDMDYDEISVDKSQLHTEGDQ